VVTLILRKAVYALVIMWLASIVVFVALRITPGDTANFKVTAIETPQRLAEVRHELGLDRPMIVQYEDFWSHLLRGDVGVSQITGEPITKIIGTGAPYTLALAGAAAILVYGLGIPLGVLAALRRNSWIDLIASGVAVVGMGVPNFVLAILLIMLFGIRLGWLPVSGSGDLQHLILPALVLAVEPLAVTVRLMRSSVLEQLGLDYVRTLVAKGLPQWRIIWQHVLWNSIGPIVSLAAVQFRSLLGYALIVEVIFRWPGLGSRLVSAVLTRDYTVAQIFALFLTLLVILFNFAADIALVIVYPRTRGQATKA
jgi:ABC-type dipeptide/oligopeptide/nickel transport system permease component